MANDNNSHGMIAVDKTQAVVTPSDYKTGDLIYPYSAAKK